MLALHTSHTLKCCSASPLIPPLRITVLLCFHPYVRPISTLAATHQPTTPRAPIPFPPLPTLTPTYQPSNTVYGCVISPHFLSHSNPQTTARVAAGERLNQIQASIKKKEAEAEQKDETEKVQFSVVVPIATSYQLSATSLRECNEARGQGATFTV